VLRKFIPQMRKFFSPYKPSKKKSKYERWNVG
jgi:hypothetical protein